MVSEPLRALATQPITRVKRTPAELTAELGVLGTRWSVVGPDLRLELRGGKMASYAPAVAYIAGLADELDHHPNLALEYAGLTLTIHTHDAAAITALDIVFAARVEVWLRAHAAMSAPPV
jgi:4a-hydroxytetrahydrobiopterin dehydratase